MTVKLHELEALERTVQEIEALEAIYGGYEKEAEAAATKTEGFIVHSDAQLVNARSALEKKSDLGNFEIPQLDVEVRLLIRLDDMEADDHGTDDTIIFVSLRCRFPPGYPNQAALVSATVDGMRRAAREELSACLVTKAQELVGEEAVMELVEETRELAVMLARKERQAGCQAKTRETAATKTCTSFGRRWIWVHHITDSDRRRSIIKEAHDLELGGYLKSGYPGVVVVEGEATSCDDFVAWIKGNKSRPGGFGRNWGHHVRGEMELPWGERQLPAVFEELEDIAVLGGQCTKCGLEAEFKEYVMQHH